MLRVSVAQQQPLSDALTKACFERFQASQDANFLVPALPGMQRPAVLMVSVFFLFALVKQPVLCTCHVCVYAPYVDRLMTCRAFLYNATS